jgi:hypothetical protein
MNNFTTAYSRFLYFLLPLGFFLIWYLGCAFTEWVFDPREMTSSMRFVIMWFGLIMAFFGFGIAYFVNDKQEY